MKNLSPDFFVTDLSPFQDFMWVLLTSGVFLMALSLPRFLVHATSSKEFKEKQDQFFEDSIEMLSSSIIILVSYLFLLDYLDEPSKLAIGVLGVIALVFGYIGSPQWLKTIKGRAMTWREKCTFRVAIAIAVFLLVFDILVTFRYIVV